jgi:hypothetical protein
MLLPITSTVLPKRSITAVEQMAAPSPLNRSSSAVIATTPVSDPASPVVDREVTVAELGDESGAACEASRVAAWAVDGNGIRLALGRCSSRYFEHWPRACPDHQGSYLFLDGRLMLLTCS